MSKEKVWKICIAIVMVIVVLGYTPLFIPVGKSKPMLMGIPYTLWMGIFATILLVVLTYIGSKAHPGSDINKEDS